METLKADTAALEVVGVAIDPIDTTPATIEDSRIGDPTAALDMLTKYVASQRAQIDNLTKIQNLLVEYRTQRDRLENMKSIMREVPFDAIKI